MLEGAGAAVQRWLRVPPPPQPPAGSAASTRVFRAARGFFRRRLIEWGLAQAGTLVGLAFGLAASQYIPERADRLIGGTIRLFEALGLALFLAQLLLSYLVLRMDYRLRWYIVTDRSLRIREGIFRIREQTVSFANIQNVAVRQGPLQRWLGIADLEIRTAGGGDSGDESRGGKENLHRAVFRGVDNAAEIRDLIRADLRRLRRAARADAPSGGDSEPAADSLLTASRRLADAAAALRAAVAAG